MATERLYYADADLLTFTAAIQAVREDGGRMTIALERSAFYPEGGGQPADHGRLGTATVDDVQVDAEGIVWHRLSGGSDVPAVGSTVTGAVDGARRLDHMQQHCGQHILTAAFIATGGWETVSFHLSEQSVTIDLSTASLSEADLRRAEAWANAQIWANLPIRARFVDEAELAGLTLRKPPSVREQIRVVSIGEIDHSACGGTHPTRSGGVGALAVLGWEKQRGQARVSFACGERLVRLYGEQRLRLQGVAGLLQTSADDVTAAVERLLARQQQVQEQLQELERSHDEMLAERLSGQAAIIGGRAVVIEAVDGISPARLRRLAQLVSGLSGGVTALTVSDGSQQRVVIAVGNRGGATARTLLQHYLAISGGRGGGSAQLAEGGGPAVDGETVRRVIGELLEQPQ